MKKINICLIMAIIILSIFAKNENIVIYKLISKKEIPAQTNKIKENTITDYTLKMKSGKNYLLKGDGEINMSYLVWEKDNVVISKLPVSEDNSKAPFLIFRNKITFSTKSKMWIVPYEYDYEDDFEGNKLNNGIFFISEDGKNIIKDIKLPMENYPSILFNKGDTAIENSIGSYTNSDYFYCSSNIISVYGEITYTFPLNNRISRVAFSSDGDYFRFSDVTNNYSYLSLNNYKLIYHGLKFDISDFTASSDSKYCATINRSNGKIFIHLMDPNTHKSIKSFQTYISRIEGVPLTKQTNSNNNDHLYNIKIRFEENTNNLIITTDNKWESVVEVFNEN